MVVLAVAVAFLSGYAVRTLTDPSPDCPAEDSCAVDYRDGAWHITRTEH